MSNSGFEPGISESKCLLFLFFHIGSLNLLPKVFVCVSLTNRMDYKYLAHKKYKFETIQLHIVIIVPECPFDQEQRRVSCQMPTDFSFLLYS